MGIMSSLKKDLISFIKISSLNPYQALIVIILCAILFTTGALLGSFLGYSEVEKAHIKATYIYCSDVNREACEEFCCTLKNEICDFVILSD